MKVTKEMSKQVEEVEDRVLRFIGSDETVDRDGDKVLVSGWKLKNYKSNPVILINHKTPSDSVGYAIAKKVWIDNNKNALMFDIEFPPPEVSSVGDSLYKWYKWAGVGATSVSFIPNYTTIEYKDRKDKQGTVRIIKEQELVELSLVSCPANPSAIMTNKSLEDAVTAEVIDDIEYKELQNWFKSVETLDDYKPPEQSPEEKELQEAKAKIAELETKLIEKENKDLEEDVFYKELFDTFRKDTTVVDDLYDEIKAEENEADILYSDIIEDLTI